MNNVTIFMPVSREEFLDVIFHALEILECDSKKTNLLVLVDGDNKLFVNVRNRVEMSKFNKRLCVQFKSNEKLRNYNLLTRRQRISDIHNESKKYIKDCDYVLGLEDDTLFPSNTLKKLLYNYQVRPYAGFIQGVEMGRWGIPYVGAWKVDDIYNPTKITSMLETRTLSTPWKDQVEEIDSGGFYCYLTTKDNYLNHDYKPFQVNALGPDVDFGIALRQQGLLNYVDWSIKCVHKKTEKDVSFTTTTPRVVTMIKKDEGWRQSNSKDSKDI